MFSGSVHAATVDYQYDELYRLIEERFDSGVVITYEYDELGNRTRRTVTPPGSVDTDGDGVPDADDSAPNDPFVCRDADADGCDDCSSGTDAPANDGTDTDSDGLCDLGDADDDDDGVLDDGDASGDPDDARCTGGNTILCDDNCPLIANPSQADSDGDGIGDACDTVNPICHPEFGAPSLVNPTPEADWQDTHPQLAAYGPGSWALIWESEDSLGGTIGHDDDILIARTTDYGASWTAPTPANGGAAVDSRGEYYPQIVRGAPGSLLAVWASNDSLGGTIGNDGDIIVARSSDDGASWTSPVALNDNASSDTGGDGLPHLAGDGSGIWVAVWMSEDSLGGTIGTDRDILVSRSLDDGVTWSPVAALNTDASTDSDSDEMPAVATDSAGTWIVAWESQGPNPNGTDPDITIVRSIDDGASWSPHLDLTENEVGYRRQDERASIATDGQGNWIVAWDSWDPSDLSNLDLEIYFAASSDNGITWSTPANVNTNELIDSGDDREPHVAAGGNGSWVVVWHSDDSLGGTIGTDLDIVLSHSTDLGATWTPAAPLHAYAETDVEVDKYPRVSTDGAGGWLATWMSSESFGGTIPHGNDIFVSVGSLSCCGDGVVGLGEECDDSNLADGDGCSATCEVEDSWQFTGIAQGGSITFTVDGISLEVTTIAGQTALIVAQNVADAINSDPTLSATGVSAFVVGPEVVTNGTLADELIDDLGLNPPVIPALSGQVIMVMTLILTILGVVALRGRRVAAM